MDEFRVTGVEKLSKLAAQFKAAGDEGKGLKKELRAGIKTAMQPMAAAVRSNVLGVPVKGRQSRGLRRAISRAVKIKVLLSKNPKVRLFVDSKRLPWASLGDYLEGNRGRTRWRHPVFGDKDVWVEQTHHPYFSPGVKAHLPGVARGIDQVLKQVSERIPKGT